jgi:hypothetical protein
VARSLANGDAVRKFTFHMYSMGNGPKLDPHNLDASFLNPGSPGLNKSGDGATALVGLAAIQQAGGAGRLWAGETASANDGGQTGITDTYVDGFWCALGGVDRRRSS